MSKLMLLPIFWGFSILAQAQTFTGIGGVIPDDGNSIAFEIPVNGLPNATDTLLFGIESVCINITHTWTADLSVTLVAPDGSLVALTNGLGGDTDGYVNTCFSGNATSSIFSTWYPFTGTFRPFGDMGILNKGLNPNGTWKLLILDTYAFADAGDLVDWNISFGPQPCKPFAFESSDLPIVKIYTGGQTIVNDPKITANFIVIDNANGQRNYVNQTTSAFNGTVGIELRGNSSQGMPKKSYSVEIRDSAGADLPVSLMGLPEESDFVLQANFSDKTQMRNPLAFHTFRQMGHYASRTHFCEVLLDDSYQGTYVFTEDIKRDKNRVDIAKLTPNDISGTAVTGGYMLRIDWDRTPGWNSQFEIPNSPGFVTKFQHLYPKWDEIQPEQQHYIRTYVDSFEVALAGNAFQDTSTGWRRFADERSFMDFLILNEISRNVDGYRLSTYFYKDRDDKGGKLTMGPPWDYDLAWYNADYCDGFLTSGWAFNLNEVCPGGEKNVPFWWKRIMEDTLFAQNLACRWQHLRQGELSNLGLKAAVDSMAGVLAEAQARNFKQWPILGIYVWPNPGNLPTTYSGELQKMRSWIYQRANWMDATLGQNLPNINANFTITSGVGLNWQFTPVLSAPGYQYYWEFGDGSTSTEATPVHEYSNLGSYNVRLTVSTPFGCDNTTQQTMTIVNGATAAALSEAGISVFPNPADDLLWVNINEANTGDWQLVLRNSIGVEVAQQTLSGQVTQQAISLAALPSGVYWLEMTGAKGRFAGKVVVR